MTTRFKFRRGSSTEWEAVNPTLAAGEPGYDIDTHLFKIGNGSSTWVDLPYFVDGFTQHGLTQEMIDQAIADGSGNDSRIGEMDLLTTVIKDTIVEAINEVNTPMVPFTVLYENAKAG